MDAMTYTTLRANLASTPDNARRLLSAVEQLHGDKGSARELAG